MAPETPSSVAVTQLLLRWGEGDAGALEHLTPLVYNELRKLAQWHMGHERHARTLQATALVHEAYLRLIDVNQIRWQDRAHFFAMAARQMRRVLIDASRKRSSQKRGGALEKVSLTQALVIHDRPEAFVALDDALQALAQLDQRRAAVVELKFFGGLGADEIAHVLGVSADTVKRDWKLAKAWLSRELRKVCQ